ncbi:MAG: hypothetical protein Q9181_004540 [Wetmoreana brouardii]
MPVTRRAAKIREASGIPPSPQNELPRELGGTQRRRKKATNTARSTVTPESDPDPASQQNQVHAHALREGNAGGYVESAPSTRNTREQQDSLPDLDTQFISPETKEAVATPQRNGFEEAAAAVGIFRGSPPVGHFVPAKVIHTPPHSPTATPTSITQPVSDSTSLANDKFAQVGVVTAQFTMEQPTLAKSVSLQTDGQSAMVASPIARQNASTQTEAQSASSVVLQGVPVETISITRDQLVQEIQPAITFRPMGLYGFRSELALPPRSCSLTIHLGAGKEVRVSNVPAEAMHELAGILHNHHSTFERSWLTPEDVVVAAENPPQSSTKRKRDDEVETPHSAQRRRIEVEAESTPTPSPHPPQPLRKVSRLRQMALKRNRGLTSPKQPNSVDPILPTETESIAQYSQDGELRLLAPISSSPHNGDAESGIQISEATAITAADPHGPQASTESVSNQTNEQVAQTQTPQTGSWRLGSIFSTARRYMPSIRRQQNPFPAPQTIRPTIQAEGSSDRSEVSAAQHIAQTEPRRQDQRSVQIDTEARSNFTQRLRDSQQATQKSFRTKEKIGEIKKLRAEKERMKAEWAKLEEERRITEKEKKDVENAHRAAYAAQKPGSKRPRISPQVIPNPPGVSYGLDATYFGASSSEEEEASPSRKARPFKVRRIRGSNQSDISTHNALGSQGTSPVNVMRTSPETSALHYTGSRFADSPPNVFGQSGAPSKQDEQGSKGVPSTPMVRELLRPDGTVLRLSDPKFNHSGHFEVPWSPSSSEEDEDEEPTWETPDTEQASPLSSDHEAMTGQESDVTTATPASDEPRGPVLQPAGVLAPTKLSPAAITQPSVTPSSKQAGPLTVQEPLATPAPKQSAPTTGMGKNLEASKTLERNRQMLRAQLAGQPGRSVLSPKDILNSPSKAQLSSQSLKVPTTQPSSPAGASQTPSQHGLSSTQIEKPLFMQPGGAQSSQTPVYSDAQAGNQVNVDSVKDSQGEDDFSILGAASRTSPKSPGRMLAETLPSVQKKVSGMQAYSEYLLKVDPKVKEVLESSWGASDDEASANAFRSPFTTFVKAQQAEASNRALKPVRQSQNRGPFVDDSDDEDDALLYGNEQRTAAGGVDVDGEFVMDPTVATYLGSQWTPEDEAYSSDEFKNHYTQHKAAAAGAAASTPSGGITLGPAMLPTPPLVEY